jgi:thymidylate kinase
VKEKQTVIIFDGPDGCGKTNIAQALSSAIGIPYFKNADEHKYFRSDPNYFIHAIKYVDTYFTSYLERTGSSIILDRAWPSEWIYSSVLSRKTDHDTLKDLDTRYANLNTIIIIPYRTSYDSVNEEYDEVKNKLSEIDAKYREFAKWSQCHTLLMNVDSEDLQHQLHVIVNFMQDVYNTSSKLYYIV